MYIYDLCMLAVLSYNQYVNKNLHNCKNITDQKVTCMCYVYCMYIVCIMYVFRYPDKMPENVHGQNAGRQNARGQNARKYKTGQNAR